MTTVKEAEEIDLSSEPVFRLGPVRIDPIAREAEIGGETERIQPQNLKVLIALAHQRGHVVSRDELIKRCWDGRVIGDDVINRAISTLRQFAERVGGFAIETVPRSGYRLIEIPSSKRRILEFGWTAAIVMVLSMTAFMVSRRPHAAPVPSRSMTVALAPFRVGSPDPVIGQLAFEAHDALSHALSQSRLSVVLPDSGPESRASGVDFIISGDVADDGDRVAVTVTMVKAADQTVVYSHRFAERRTNAAALADRLGPQVAGAIGWTAPLLMIDRQHPSDPQVLRELFREVGTITDDPLSDYERNRQIAAKAPTSAIAQLAFAFSAGDGIIFLDRRDRPAGIAAGLNAQRRARQLAPSFGEPFIPSCALHPKVQLALCEDNLWQARHVDPGSPFVDFYLGEALLDVGRYAEARDEAVRSLAGDPYVPAKINLALRTQGAVGIPVVGSTLMANAKQWYSDGVPSVFNWVWAAVSGMIDHGSLGSIRQFERSVPRTAMPKDYVPLTPIVEPTLVNNVPRLRAVCAQQHIDSLNGILCILALARAGDFNSAFAYADRIYPRTLGRTSAETERIWLDKPFETGTEFIVGPGAAALRTDSRYLALAERVGLLAYWRDGRPPDFCRPPKPEPICQLIMRR